MLSAHYMNKLSSFSVIDHLLDWLLFPFKSSKIRLSIRAMVHFLSQSLGLEQSSERGFRARTFKDYHADIV